jgi:thioredoxin-like negative regulator of GroEL
MIERILVIFILALIGYGAYAAFKALHVLRLGRVAKSSKPLLLYFRSEHCAPCVTQTHFLDQLEGKWHGRLAIQKIDTDAEPEKAQQFGVFTLPTTILVDNVGKVRHINYGLTNVQKLLQQLSAL